jgi:hypothetical protein
MKKTIQTIAWVVIFSIAMAYLESTIVVYLRHIYGIKNLLTDLPTKPDQFTIIEVGREFCTLVMLAAIGWIAGRNFGEKLAYAFISFGIWDIFYYIWLYVFIGWPASISEWDILFLIPMPWWGPVWSPVVISLYMVAGGIITVIKSEKGIKVKPSVIDWSVLTISILIALYVFMEDSIPVYPNGAEALAKVKPVHFNLILFLLSVLGMGYFVFRIARQKPE